jgi:hypothetical protein
MTLGKKEKHIFQENKNKVDVGAREGLLSSCGVMAGKGIV